MSEKPINSYYKKKTMREIILTQLKETTCHMELLSFYLKINNNKINSH